MTYECYFVPNKFIFCMTLRYSFLEFEKKQQFKKLVCHVIESCECRGGGFSIHTVDYYFYLRFQTAIRSELLK